MTYREIQVPAGTRRVLEFTTTYSQNWSVESQRGDNIEAADVSNATFLLKKHVNALDADAVVSKTLDAGISVTTGKVTVTLNAADTDELQGKYFGTLRLYLVDDGVIDWADADYEETPYIVLTFTQGAVEATS